jgi:type IV pilus assembly protein PilO
MMGVRRTNRLWLLGGLFAIIVIVLAAYLLAIKPTYADRADKEGQADDQATALIALQRQLADLTAKAENQATYTAQLNAKVAAMPETYDLPNFLRALQTSESAVTVKVSGISDGAPTKVNGSGAILSVTITLTAGGTPANLSKFLNRLQNVQSRAVLVRSVTLSAADKPTQMSATVVVDGFCRKSDACKAAS